MIGYVTASLPRVQKPVLDTADPRSYLPPRHGAVAQLGERVVRNDEVSGSIPLGSTILRSLRELRPGRPNTLPGEGCPAAALAKADTPVSNTPHGLALAARASARQAQRSSSEAALVRPENKAPPDPRWGLVSIRPGLADRAGYRLHCADDGAVLRGCPGIRRHRRIRGSHHSAGGCRPAVRRV